MEGETPKNQKSILVNDVDKTPNHELKERIKKELLKLAPRTKEWAERQMKLRPRSIPKLGKRNTRKNP